MNNPACTVCHIPMDPVAGAYQNYGNNGLFRDKRGGMDSLPNLYKYPKDGTTSPYQRGDTWFRDMREPGFDGMTAPSADNSLQCWRSRWLRTSGSRVRPSGSGGRRSWAWNSSSLPLTPPIRISM